MQKFALRICSSQYGESYENLLDIFQTPTLFNRRLFLSLCTFLKSFMGMFTFLLFSHQLLYIAHETTTHKHSASHLLTPTASSLLSCIKLYVCGTTYLKKLSQQIIYIVLSSIYHHYSYIHNFT